jgi:hypothetical protein
VATLTLSVALAATKTVPETEALFDGAVIDTVGGVVSGALLSTFTFTAALAALFPAASVATAVRIWLPFESVAVFKEYA